jgi:prepilin-type N-terminal cleavage/methylation domain-containing protein
MEVHMKALTHHNRSKGFTLVELAIAIAISALVISGGLAFQLDTVRKQQASAQGDQIKTLNGYVAIYETNYYGNLVNGTPIAGVANEYAPTVAELKAIGAIPNSLNATNLYGGGFTISVSKTPTGCVAPNCDITGTVALNNVIKNPVSGTPDYPLLGTAASEAGGDAGFSDSSAPANISGLNGTFTLANPNGAVAGILGMRSGYGSSGFSQFLRRDGSLPMIGNLDMGNNSVNNAATVTATGLTVNGNASFIGTINAGNINGSNFAAIGNVTATGNMTASGTTSGGYLKANNTVTAQAACSPNGIVGEDASNALYSCQSGTWKQATGSGTVIPVSQLPSTFSGHQAYVPSLPSAFYYTSGYALYLNYPGFGNYLVCGNFTSSCTNVCSDGLGSYSNFYYLNTTGIIATGGGGSCSLPVGNFPWS